MILTLAFRQSVSRSHPPRGDAGRYSVFDRARCRPARTLLGSSRMITNMIEKTHSDLWITTFGAKSFEEGGILLTPGSGIRRWRRLESPP